MQIILQEDIDKLGHRGDVVTVKPGYARNYCCRAASRLKRQRGT